MIASISAGLALDWSPLVLLVVTAAVVVSIVLFYRRARRVLQPRTFRLLLAMRLAAMAMLLICLFRPYVCYEHSRMAQSLLYVLVDRSRSMSIHDYPDQPTRSESARSVLLRAAGLRDRLRGDFDLRWYAFASHAEPLDAAGALDYQEPTGLATDLTTSIKSALGNEDKSKIAGIILLTDGIDNSVSDPVAELAQLGVPIYPIAVGSKLREQPNYRDILVTKVDAKRTIAINTAAEISVYVDAVGYADRVVPVQLREGDKLVTTADLVLDDRKGSQKVTLRYTPETLGEHELAIEIPFDSAERIRENNKSSLAVFATQPKIKVLYIEGAVRSEYREVRRLLEQDPNVELLSLVRIGPVRFMKQGGIKGVDLEAFPETLDQMKLFDVLIVGNLDAAFMRPQQMESLEQAVREGLGFMMIGGESSFGPGGYAGTPIERILPVTMGGRNDGQERQPFPLTLSAAGMRHPIFAGCTDFFRREDRREGVPDLRGCSMVTGTKPGASVLAVNSNRRLGDQPLPVVSVQQYGRGRTMVNTADTTWLWYMPLRGMGRESPFVKFWAQSVRWLAGEDEDTRLQGAGVVAYADKHFYEAGAKPVFYARACDPQGLATDFASVTAAITRVEDKVVTPMQMTYVPGSRGRYEVSLGVQQPGKYEVEVAASLEGQELGRTKFGFRVGQPNKEFENLDLNAELLQRLARISNGQYFTLLSADQLANLLQERVNRERVTTTFPDWLDPRQRDIAMGLLFVAFVLIIAGEWILRKRRYLS